MTCQHKWVLYTPFRGDSFECCANEGCKMTKLEFETQNQGATDLRSGYYDPQMELADWAKTRGGHITAKGYFASGQGGGGSGSGLPMGRSPNAPPCPVIDHSKKRDDDYNRITQGSLDDILKNYYPDKDVK